MAHSIPSLWPKTIRTDVQTPLAILRAQAEALTALTQGVLEGEVKITLGDQTQENQFFVSAPALDYKHLVLAAEHKKDLPYPVEVDAECFHPDGSESFNMPERPTARTPEQFQELVAKVLSSSEVETVLLSLISRSNEAADTPAVSAEPANGPVAGQD